MIHIYRLMRLGREIWASYIIKNGPQGFWVIQHHAPLASVKIFRERQK